VPLVQLRSNLKVVTHGRTFLRGVPQEVTEDFLHSLMHQRHMFEIVGQFPQLVYVRRLPLLSRQKAEIVVTRDMGLGDLLLLVPAIRGMKRVYPGLRITFATSSRYIPLFDGGWIGDVERVVSLLSLQGRFNSIDLRGYSERATDKNTHHRTDVFANYLNVLPLLPEEYDVRIPLSDEEVVQAGMRLSAAGWDGVRPLVGISAGASAKYRSIPPSTVANLAATLIGRGMRVVMLDDRPMGVSAEGVIDMGGKTTVREFAAFVSLCDATVSGDTGTYHLASAVGTPNVAVFSIVPPELRSAHYPLTENIFHRELPCAPCWGVGCAATPCLTRVSIGELTDALERALLKSRRLRFEPGAPHMTMPIAEIGVAATA
jgi:ADP-heptose:LPS heptosyltransferase